jgi:hypothetical protein
MKPTPFHDFVAATLVRFTAPLLRFLAYNRPDLPRFAAAADRATVQFRTTHFYEPTYAADHLPSVIDQERLLPGLDLNAAAQLSLLRSFCWADELAQFPLTKTVPDQFGYEGTQYAHGDADMLYSFVRHFMPKRIVEIGSGDSTLVARAAIARNKRETPDYECSHICVEPYANAWLESTGAQIIRERVENVDPSLFRQLRADDILFIDSSHVIRPFGDVLTEHLQIVPSVAPGVIVHVHDIFTPRDYPAKWLLQMRRLWNEQYLLEAFLSFNSEFEVLAATNWLSHQHPEELKRICGYPDRAIAAGPSSFCYRRRR